MSAQTAPELRGNWEDRPRPTADGSSSLWWPKTPSECACPMCRKGLLHTEAEHEQLYGPARKAQLEQERKEEAAQVERDTAYLDKLVASGMTEDQAVDEWMARINSGVDI